MAKVCEIRDFLGEIAPFEMKMDFDNVGFLAGNSTDEVTKIMASLDITDEVIDEAEEKGANLIVSHHPMFFSLKNVTDEDMTGKRVMRLLRKGMNAICMHTNLDAAKGGVNDLLAKKAGLTDIELLCVDGVTKDGEEYCVGRVGQLREPMPMEEYLTRIKYALQAGGLRYHSAGIPVKKVAVVGGSGMSMISEVLKKGCDTFITSDIKYDAFLDARAGGYNLIDADHFCTENVVVPYLAGSISKKFPDIDVLISERHCQTAKFI